MSGRPLYGSSGSNPKSSIVNAPRTETKALATNGSENGIINGTSESNPIFPRPPQSSPGFPHLNNELSSSSTIGKRPSGRKYSRTNNGLANTNSETYTETSQKPRKLSDKGPIFSNSYSSVTDGWKRDEVAELKSTTGVTSEEKSSKPVESVPWKKRRSRHRKSVDRSVGRTDESVYDGTKLNEFVTSWDSPPKPSPHLLSDSSNSFEESKSSAGQKHEDDGRGDFKRYDSAKSPKTSSSTSHLGRFISDNHIRSNNKSRESSERKMSRAVSSKVSSSTVYDVESGAVSSTSSVRGSQDYTTLPYLPEGRDPLHLEPLRQRRSTSSSLFGSRRIIYSSVTGRKMSVSEVDQLNLLLKENKSDAGTDGAGDWSDVESIDNTREGSRAPSGNASRAPSVSSRAVDRKAMDELLHREDEGKNDRSQGTSLEIINEPQYFYPINRRISDGSLRSRRKVSATIKITDSPDDYPSQQQQSLVAMTPIVVPKRNTVFPPILEEHNSTSTMYTNRYIRKKTNSKFLKGNASDSRLRKNDSSHEFMPLIFSGNISKGSSSGGGGGGLTDVKMTKKQSAFAKLMESRQKPQKPDHQDGIAAVDVVNLVAKIAHKIHTEHDHLSHEEGQDTTTSSTTTTNTTPSTNTTTTTSFVKPMMKIDVTRPESPVPSTLSPTSNRERDHFNFVHDNSRLRTNNSSSKFPPPVTTPRSPGNDHGPLVETPSSTKLGRRKRQSTKQNSESGLTDSHNNTTPRNSDVDGPPVRRPSSTKPTTDSAYRRHSSYVNKSNNSSNNSGLTSPTQGSGSGQVKSHSLEANNSAMLRFIKETSERLNRLMLLTAALETNTTDSLTTTTSSTNDLDNYDQDFSRPPRTGDSTVPNPGSLTTSDSRLYGSGFTPVTPRDMELSDSSRITPVEYAFPITPSS